eukprot:s465_g21.t1
MDIYCLKSWCRTTGHLKGKGPESEGLVLALRHVLTSRTNCHHCIHTVPFNCLRARSACVEGRHPVHFWSVRLLKNRGAPLRSTKRIGGPSPSLLGNGAGQGVNVGEANVGEANVGRTGDLQHPAAAPEGGDGVRLLVPAESSGVQGTKPDDPPPQPENSEGADVNPTETKEGKNPSEKP